jgi:2-keto-4-pentenoate hydratase/2-oxohepta-3-ene-1,7-dioic acid hydratase in catechol pathway
MRLVRSGGATGLILDRPAPGTSPAVLEIGASVPALRQRNGAAAAVLQEYLAADAASWVPAIRAWDLVGDALEALACFAAEADAPLPLTALAQARLDPPLPDPGARIHALGGNFASHVSGAAGATDLAAGLGHGPADGVPPWGYYVIPGTVIGPDHMVTPPPGTRTLDYEAEVCVVLGEPGYRPGQLDFPVWGYTAWNDLSIRDAAFGWSKTDHGPLTWSLTKNFRTGNACGPCLVVTDGTPGDLRITCRVNGELRQDDTTAGMICSFRETAEHIASYLPMDAGDMILSGTPAGTAMERRPSGPFLRDGDVVEVEVSGTGVLRNRISWASG